MPPGSADLRVGPDSGRTEAVNVQRATVLVPAPTGPCRRPRDGSASHGGRQRGRVRLRDRRPRPVLRPHQRHRRSLTSLVSRPPPHRSNRPTRNLTLVPLGRGAAPDSAALRGTRRRSGGRRGTRRHCLRVGPRRVGARGVPTPRAFEGLAGTPKRGHRTAFPQVRRWPGAGSNRRPSDFQRGDCVSFADESCSWVWINPDR